MQSTVTEIAEDSFRISTFNPDAGIQFNQFLIRDEAPFLMHTGMRKMFPMTLEALSTVIDPASLRWIGFSHFEPDECGALNDWLRIAPQAQAVSSFVGVTVMLDDFAERESRALADNEILHTGRHQIRFLSTPHVPHGWDAGLFFDETAQTLLCSDLFFQPGNPSPITESDIIGPVREAIVASREGPMAQDMPYTPQTDPTLKRLAGLRPRTLAAMHGSTFRGDGGTAIDELASVLREVLGTPAS